MIPIKPLSYLSGLLLGISLSYPAIAGEAISFAELAAQQRASKLPQKLSLDRLSTIQTTSQRGCLGYSPERLRERAQPYHDTITTYATRYGVDHDLIKAVIAIESCYNVTALSPKSAQGLMQLIPATASRFGVTDANDSTQNIRGGAKYLAWLIKRFDGDISKALAGYNAGEGAVDKHGGIPPYRETQNYVVNVLAVYQRLANKTTPTVMVSATQALQDDITGISSELTQALRAGTQLPDIVEVESKPHVNKQAEQPRLTAPASGVIKPPIPLLAQRKPSPQPQARLIPVVARNQTFKPTQVNAANELAARVVSGLIQGGPPMRSALTPPPQAQRKTLPKPMIAKTQTLPRPSAALQAAPRLVPSSAAPVTKRISHTFMVATSKPGRAGWEANRELAPNLYKQ